MRVDELLIRKVVVCPSATKTSLTLSSRIISDSTTDSNESVSKIIVSVVTSESSNVPVSWRIPPPTTLTTPVAASVLLSDDELVNVNMSPTW